MDIANVETLFGYDQVDPKDLRAGIQAYSVCERQVDELKGRTSVWVFDTVFCIWDTCDQLNDVAVELAEEKLNEQVQWITSDAAGALKLNPKQAKLTGRNSLAAAWKKIKAGLEMGLSMVTFDTCSKMEREVTRLNKEAKSAERDERVVSGIAKQAEEQAKVQAVELGIEEGTDEFQKLVDDLIAEMTAKYMGENSVDGEKPVEEVLAVVPGTTFTISEELRPYATELVAYAQQSLAEAIADLFRDSIPMMNGDSEKENIEKAVNQVREAIEGVRTKWVNRAESQRTKLLDRLTKSVDKEEVEAEEADGNKTAAAG